MRQHRLRELPERASIENMMTKHPASGRCPLCQRAATVEQRIEERLWVVECGECRRFTVDEDLFLILQNPISRENPRVRDLLPSLSLAAYRTWADGGRLNISLDNWRAIAHDVPVEPTRH